MTTEKYEILWCSQLPSIVRHACIFRIIECNVQESYDYVELRRIYMIPLICQFVWSDFSHLYWSYKCITDVHSFRCIAMIAVSPFILQQKELFITVKRLKWIFLIDNIVSMSACCFVNQASFVSRSETLGLMINYLGLLHLAIQATYQEEDGERSMVRFVQKTA